MVLDASIISNLENQCKALPEGSRVKVEVVRKISDELAAHMGEVRKYVSQTGCQIVFNKKENKVTIIKPKVSKKDEDLLAGLDDLNTDVDGLDEKVQKTKEEAQKTKEEAQKAKEEAQKAKEEAQKAKEEAQKAKEEAQKAERLAIMNPSREFFWVVEHFEPNFKKGNYGEIIKNLQQIKKAISGFPVEIKYYNLAMPVYKDALNQVNKKIKTENSLKIKKKLEEIKELLEYIIKHTKAKNIGLA